MGITSQIAGASPEVIGAIKTASQKTGVDFDYLVNQARTESSFQTDVKASTSSATGLYQFLDQTWLGTMAKHGAAHGMNDLASQIQKDFQGRYFVSDDTIKTKILDMRKDPQIAAIMAGEFASDNKQIVEQKTGIEATSTDLYMAHFLGANGASQYINAMKKTPNMPAAELMPRAASSNKNIFYNSDGSTRSLEQVYNNFQAKIDHVTEVQTAKVEQAPTVNNFYRRDLSFERMYGNGVQKFVSAMPSVDGFQAGNYFDGLFGNNISSMLQNKVNNQSLFLTLTMLGLPK